MRLRITFAKTDAMRFTGHLDLHRTWERTFRRANLPLAYSQGFHPQPRINLACALPLGFTSEAEVVDIWIEEDRSIEEITRTLQQALPPGITLLNMIEVDSHVPALQTQVVASEYEVTLLDSTHALDDRLNEIVGATELPRERRGKAYNLRPLIESLERISDDRNGHPRLKMRLSAQSGATGRPEEVLSALDISPESTHIHRTRLFFA